MRGERASAAGSPAAVPEAPGRTEEAAEQFRGEVFPQELDYVRDRRRSHDPAYEEQLSPARGVGNDLTGVALSGGGIRSATFNLGLLQALSRRGLFEHVDYLSTVSGGGFIGSSLTALMRREADGGAPGPAAFPFPTEERGEEADTVAYLRSHSDYLAPQGLTDYLRAFALLARGIALNLVLLVPILLIISLIGTFFFIDDLMAAARREGRLEYQRTIATQPASARPPPAARLAEPLEVTAAEGLRFRLTDRWADLWTDRAAVVAAARSPDGRRIAAAGDDGSLWLFHFEDDVDELRRESGRVLARGETLDALAFSSDGCRLIGRRANTSEKVWALVGNLAPRVLGRCMWWLSCSRMLTDAGEWRSTEEAGEAPWPVPGGAVVTPAGPVA